MKQNRFKNYGLALMLLALVFLVGIFSGWTYNTWIYVDWLAILATGYIGYKLYKS